MSEQLLVQHCSPTLAGLKTGSLFTCACGDGEAMGETVAEAGETGNATGPHLHLEIKKDGVLLNPVYYIETQ